MFVFKEIDWKEKMKILVRMTIDAVTLNTMYSKVLKISFHAVAVYSKPRSL